MADLISYTSVGFAAQRFKQLLANRDGLVVGYGQKHINVGAGLGFSRLGRDSAEYDGGKRSCLVFHIISKGYTKATL